MPCAGLLVYALRGGSYDIVVRQQEGFAVWALLGVAVAAGLAPRTRPPRAVLAPAVALGALAAWIAVSLTWTDSDEVTLGELARALHYLGLLLLAWALLDRSTWRPAVAGLAVAAVVVCGLAVASRLQPDWFPADYVQRIASDRLSYPFGYWNALAAWGAMSLALSLALSAHAARPAARAAWLAAAPVCATAVYLTYSRAGVIGSMLGVAAVVALGRNRWLTAVHAVAAAGATALVVVTIRDQEQIARALGSAGGRDVAWALAAAALGCAAVAALTWVLRGDRWRMPPPWGRVAVVAGLAAASIFGAAAAGGEIREGWAEFKDQPVAAASAADPTRRLSGLGGNRYQIWDSALEAFADDPVRGTGPGGFEFWWNRSGGTEYIRDAHSLYLEALAELGILGFLLTLTFLAALLAIALTARFKARRTRSAGAHAALAGAFIVFLFHAGVDWMWENTAVTTLAVLAAGIGAAAMGTRRIRILPGTRALLVVVCGSIALIQLPGVLSTSRLRESQDAFRRGDLAVAAERADQAIRNARWAASPRAQRALVAQAQGDLSGAARHLREAAEREPLNWRHHLLLAQVEARRGRARAALRSFRRARRLRPASPFFRTPLG